MRKDQKSMSLEVCFDAAKARRIRECISDSRPIEGVRTVDDLLLVAGACFHALVFMQPTFPPDRDWSQTTEEERKAAFDSMLKLLHATIEHCGHRLMHLAPEDDRQAPGTPYRFRATLDGEKVIFAQIDEEHGPSDL
jgi:hypothetical protein